MRNERYVRRVAEAALPTRYGDFRMIVFASDVDSEQHIALVRGDLTGAPPLVRVHSHCLTGDVFGSTDCDCHDIIEHSLEAIVAENRGVFVYLHHTGRGFGIDSTAPAPARCRIFCITRAASSTGMRRGNAAAARKRHWCANPDRPRPEELARAHQSPAKGRRARRLWPDDRGPGACPRRDEEALHQTF